MASQFESFRQPGVILVSVPLALPGAVAAFWLTGHSISVVALIGMVMLVGIVVNNAIVLVDYVNVLRRERVPTSTRRWSRRDGSGSAHHDVHDHHGPGTPALGGDPG
jgi:Cu/Ag efflux pump CusA